MPAEAASSELSGDAAASEDSSAEEPEDVSDDDAEQSGTVWCGLTLHYATSHVVGDCWCWCCLWQVHW